METWVSPKHDRHYVSHHDAYESARRSVQHPLAAFDDKFFDSTFEACGQLYDSPSFIANGEYVRFDRDYFIKKIPPAFPAEAYANDMENPEAWDFPAEEFRYFATIIPSTNTAGLTHVFVKTRYIRLFYIHFTPDNAFKEKPVLSYSFESIEEEDKPELDHLKRVQMSMSRFPHPHSASSGNCGQ